MVLAGDPPEVDFGCGSYKEYLQMQQDHPEWFNDDYLEQFIDDDTPRFQKLSKGKKDGSKSVGSKRGRGGRDGYKRARRDAEQARDEA